MGNTTSSYVSPSLDGKVNDFIDKLYAHSSPILCKRKFMGYSSMVLLLVNKFMKDNVMNTHNYRRILDIRIFYFDALNYVSNNNISMDQKREYLKASLAFIRNNLSINLHKECIRIYKS